MSLLFFSEEGTGRVALGGRVVGELGGVEGGETGQYAV